MDYGYDACTQLGIGTHFRVRAARIGLVSVGGAILAFAIVLLILAPKPIV